MNGQDYTIIEVINEDGKSTLYLMDGEGFYKKIGSYLDRGGVATARLAVQRTMEAFGFHALRDVAVRIITYLPHGQFAKAITYGVAAS